MDPVTLYKSRWIYPVASPPVNGGVIAVRDGRILECGRERDLKAHFTGRPRDLGEGVILPALINAHTHLGLSHLRGRIPRGLGFLEWVRTLLSLKESVSAECDPETMGRSVRELKLTGTGAMGDWRCTTDPLVASSGEDPVVQAFYEVIGFSEQEMVLPEFADSRPPISLGAHAPHTTSSALLLATKAWTRARSLPFAIHVAESWEEEEFLLSGNGPWREFLSERGRWLNHWAPPGTSSVKYLDRLGLLDEKTLCVHLTRANGQDIEILRHRGTQVVICPRSNQFITGDLPNLPYMLEAGLTPSLGTDSLASNDDLSLWGEMDLIHKTFSTISPAAILRMATLNGALSLGLEKEMGSLSPGKYPRPWFLPLEAGGIGELEEAILHVSGRGLVWL